VAEKLTATLSWYSESGAVQRRVTRITLEATPHPSNERTLMLEVRSAATGAPICCLYVAQPLPPPVPTWLEEPAPRLRPSVIAHAAGCPAGLCDCGATGPRRG